jgi:hypothetical protein
MKSFNLLFTLTLAFQYGFTQTDCSFPTASLFIHPNKIGTTLKVDGSMFFKLENGGFLVPYSPSGSNNLKTMDAGGLWLSGVDPAGNIKLAAATYPTMTAHDFSSGPLDYIEGTTNSLVCNNWNKIWQITKEEILLHKADYQDNGIIDNPIDAIFSWPAKGNLFFLTYNGFGLDVAMNEDMAAFNDPNGNGVYEPDQGEHPVIVNSQDLPDFIAFYIINDAGNIHTATYSNVMQIKIQVSVYAFSCEETSLNDVLFMNFKCINRGVEDLGAPNFGIWADFNLGYGYDDYIGCDTSLNSFYVYNADNEDVNEPIGLGGYGSNPPVQSITFLNRPLSKFMYHSKGQPDVPFAQTPPENFIEYYRYLTGKWRDGTPLTIGGSGYEYSDEMTSWAMPDNPNDTTGWSMRTSDQLPFHYRGLGITDIPTIEPSASVEIHTAFAFHRGEEMNHLENVNVMEVEIAEIQELYDNEFEGICNSMKLPHLQSPGFTLSPNPAKDKISIQSMEDVIQEIQISDISGKVVLSINHINETSMTCDIRKLPVGVYFIKIVSKGNHKIMPLVVQR